MNSDHFARVRLRRQNHLTPVRAGVLSALALTFVVRVASADAAGGATASEASTDHGTGDRAQVRAKSPEIRAEAAAGVGWSSEDEARDQARYTEGALAVEYVGVPKVVLGLELELRSYDRTYVTPYPARSGAGLLRVEGSETRFRPGLSAGWDALEAWASPEAKRAGVVPGLLVHLDQFRNDVVPYSSLELGLGVAGFVRLSERLRLQGGASYEYAVALDDTHADRLVFGMPLGVWRYEAGPLLEFMPRATVQLKYAGEWLTYEHASRVSNGLFLGLSLTI